MFARCAGGLLFVPFHHGYWDTPAGDRPGDGEPGRAANETVPTAGSEGVR
jgi:hypothetical protein